MTTSSPLPDTERKHHPYSPSQLAMLEASPCYVGREGTANERAIAGTLAHKVAETGVDDNDLEDHDAAAVAQCLDEYATRLGVVEMMKTEHENNLRSQNIPITEKNSPPILELKESYLPIDDAVFKDFERQPDGSIKQVTTEATTAGYQDRAIIWMDYAELFDHKFGFWPVEKAAENPQGIGYTLGLFKKYPQLKKIRVTFQMPHLNWSTSHTFTREEIPALYLRLQTIVARAREVRTQIVVNDDFSNAVPRIPACNFCGNLGKCPKVAEYALKVGKKFFPIEIPEDITPGRVFDKTQTTLALRLAGVVKAWAEAFKSRLTDAVLRQESPIPEGYRLQQGTGRRKVIDEKKFREYALKFVTEQEYNDCTSVGIGAVEELIHERAMRGQKKNAVESFARGLLDVKAVEAGQPYTFLRQVAGKSD